MKLPEQRPPPTPPKSMESIAPLLSQLRTVLHEEGVCFAGVFFFPVEHALASVAIYPVELEMVPTELAAITLIAENKISKADLGLLILATMTQWRSNTPPEPLEGTDTSQDLYQLSPEVEKQLEELSKLLNLPPNFKHEDS